jgi:hypothetical protein
MSHDIWLVSRLSQSEDAAFKSNARDEVLSDKICYRHWWELFSS